MLDKTLGYVLCCQSPALFLAALVLIVHYFAARRKHRFKAVLKLLLGIVCAVGGVVLYYLGMYHEYFTIRDFYQIRLSGWIGFGIVALLTLASLVRAFFAAADARREEKHPLCTYARMSIQDIFRCKYSQVLAQHHQLLLSQHLHLLSDKKVLHNRLLRLYSSHL